MNKRYFLLAINMIFILTSCKDEKKPEAKPLEVPVVTVLQQDVKIQSEFTGQTYGQSDIQINPRVDGVIESMNFKEGSLVTKGQLLYTIDPLPYKTKVDEAQSALAQSQARLSKAQSDLKMIEPLAKMNAVSQRELNGAQSSYSATMAQVDAQQASLQNAKIELGYCRILAPISGLIGISKVKEGDYVRPGPLSVLNTISDMTDIRVRFTISEQEFLRIYREINKKGSNLKGSGQTISLILSDGSIYPQTGKVSFANREIDPTTGAMTLEAAFPNPDKLLRPGQYVKVEVVTDVKKNVLVIPQRSVIEMQGITQVFVMESGNKVNAKIIQLGPSFGDAYVVEDGLKAGDKIVMGGSSLLKNGSVIAPKITEWNSQTSK